jgi:hypothetical protein
MEVIVACFKIRRWHLYRGIGGNDNSSNVSINVKLRRVRLTIVVKEKHTVLHIMTVCLHP